MKKIVIMFAVLVLFAGSAYAGTLTPDADKADSGAVLDVTGSISNVTDFFNFSKGVYAGAETNQYGYALTTAHKNGSKYFGTGYDSTALYRKSTTNGGVVTDTLTAPTSSVAGDVFTTASGWTAM